MYTHPQPPTAESLLLEWVIFPPQFDESLEVATLYSVAMNTGFFGSWEEEDNSGQRRIRDFMYVTHAFITVRFRIMFLLHCLQIVYSDKIA